MKDNNFKLISSLMNLDTKKHYFVRIFLRGILFFMIFFILLEIGMRMCLPYLFSINSTRKFSEKNDKMRGIFIGDSLYKIDSVCMYIPKEGFFRKDDSYGICSEEKEKNEVRIICVGDSATFCSYLPYDKSWPYFLGKFLQKEFPDKYINVLNAGYEGLSSRNIKRIFQFYLVDYNPDIVFFRTDAHLLTDSYQVTDRLNFIQKVLLTILTKSKVSHFCENFFREEYNYNMFYGIQNLFSSKLTTTKEFSCDWDVLKKIASDHNIFHIALVDRVTYRKKDNLLSTNYNYLVANGNGPIVNTYMALISNFNEPLFVDSIHLNENGTQIIAQEVAALVLKKGWIK